MKLSGPSSPPPVRAGRLRGLRGFSLLELSLALLSLGLVAYIATAEIRKFRQRAQRDHFIADVRCIAEAFEAYQAQKGEWPPATNPEVRVPRGMEAALAGTAWLAGPPFGGSYDWMPPSRSNPGTDEAGKKTTPPGMIAVTAFSPGPPLALAPADLLYLDRKLDDGDLATGRFRAGFNGWPVYLVNATR